MPLNVPGILAPLQFLVNPRVIVPGLSVKDIRHLDFLALKRAGYKGVVFDKDNCLTLPGKDTLVPDLEEAWSECRQVFGEGNILVVSNSAGTQQMDAGGIKAESVKHHLQVPVLFHGSMKPAYSCVNQIRSYFSSLRDPVKDDELIVVGDRLFTDIVMSHRLREKNWKERFGIRNMAPTTTSETALPLPTTRTTLGIWTTGIWTKEATFMRFCERKLLEGVKKWVVGSTQARVNSRAVKQVGGVSKESEMRDVTTSEAEEEVLARAFVRQVPPPPPKKKTILQNMFGLVQGVQFRRS